MSLIGQPVAIFAPGDTINDETVIFSGVVVESQPHPASGSWSVLIEVVETNPKRCSLSVGTVVKINCDHWEMLGANRIRRLRGAEGDRILALHAPQSPSNGAAARESWTGAAK